MIVEAGVMFFVSQSDRDSLYYYAIHSKVHLHSMWSTRLKVQESTLHNIIMPSGGQTKKCDKLYLNVRHT